MLNINRLCAWDLFSYESLDISLKNRGLVAVEGENRDLGGSNGSGKSNLIKSLCWIPFGKVPQDGETLSGDDVIREDLDHQPIKGKTRGFLEVDTETANIQIFRHRAHAEYGNKLLLYVDGQDETMSSDAETQKKIEEYLGIDYDGWVHAIMFPQDASSFANLTDAKQKGVLDSLLSTERFERARKRAKEQIKQIEVPLQRLQGQLSVIRNQIINQQSQVKTLIDQESEWEQKRQAEIQSLVADRKQLERNPPDEAKNVEIIQSRIAELQQKLAGCDTMQLHRTRDELLQKHATQRSLVQQLSGWRNYPEPVWETAIEASMSELDVATLQQEVDAASREVYLLQSSISATRAAISRRDQTTICETCNQPLSDEVKSRMFGNLDARLKDESQRLEEATRKHGSLHHALEYHRFKESHQQWVAGQAALMTADAELARIEAEGVRVRQLLDAYNELLAQQRCLQEATQADQRWQDAITRLQLEIKSKQELVSPYAELIVKARDEAMQLGRKFQSQQRIADKLEMQVQALRFWEEGFGPKGVRSLLLDHITPELNRISNEYLAILTNGTARMEFHTTKQLKNGERRDNFHVEVQYSYGAGSYKKISGGERQRPDIAAMFALGDLAAARSRSPIQLRLLDEPFDGLDGLGAEQVVEVLRAKVLPKVGTILLMTHDDNLKQLIDDRIVIVKEDGVSRLLQ